ncbi:MAG: tetratricopeptide repeat protein [Planctomycetota bacterium]
MSEPFTAPTRVPPAVRRAGDHVLEQAEGALRARHWREAERLCRQVLRVDPDHPAGVHLLGRATFRGGHLYDAVSLLRRAVELDDRQPAWWHDLALAYEAGDRLAHAADCCRAALRLQPYSVPAIVTLGRSLSGMGLLRDAVAAFAQVLRLDPDHAEARRRLDQLTDQLRQAA